MKNKTLNYLILVLLTCIASIGLTTLSILSKNNDRFYLNLIMILLSVILDFIGVLLFYGAIKSSFKLKTELTIWVAGGSALLYIILWSAFKHTVFEGVFDLMMSIDMLYLSFFNNVFKQIIQSVLTYFGTTLFSATDVINQMVIFTLKIFSNLMSFVIIPLLPGILIFRDLLRGNEEYKFTKEELEDFNELKL